MARWVFASLAGVAAGLTLPGQQPNDYRAGDVVPMKVNKLWSPRTQLTFNYYSLPVCKPDNPEVDPESFGQIIMGDRIMSSDYHLILGQDVKCEVLCTRQMSAEDAAVFKERIDNDYAVSWLVDGLPASVRMVEEGDSSKVHLERNFPLGHTIETAASGAKRWFLFNHIQFVVYYHQEPGNPVLQPDVDAPGGVGVVAGTDAAAPAEEINPSNADAANAAGAVYRIVGFEVEPFSVAHTKVDAAGEWVSTNLAMCNQNKQMTRALDPQFIDEPTEVVFTYDVTWMSSQVPYYRRMEVFLTSTGDDDIHWFSIINSLMIVLFLTGMIAMILVRNLYRDIARYNEEANSEEAMEESGWKLVHGDVFRPPAGFFGPMFLSVFVGSGMQILAMSLVLMVFAVLGFLSPANQGSLLTAFILVFQFMGAAAGYVSSRIYKMFKGKAWKRNTTLTAFAFPGTIYGIAFLLNFIVYSQRSSLAVPIGTMLTLAALWFGIAVPLVFLGSYMGFRADEITHPVRVKNIPRQIPTQPWYLHPIPSILVGGVLPFGAVFIELFFIMSSIWQARAYYFFSFLLLVLLILVVTCAEISIVMAYFQLCAEDYNWWWRSFLTSGSSALYLFLYAIAYFYTKLDISSPLSAAWYFGYMAMASWGFFLLTGSIGFVACLAFVNRIYAAIKVD